MPDDRFFHKCLGHSEKVNSLTDFEDLVWRSYVLAADDFGLMRFSANALRADNDRLGRKPHKVVERALEAVRKVGLIRTFIHQEFTYCYQHNWQDYQKITYPKRTVNPHPPVDAILQCTDNTRWLFQIFPGGKKLATWICPKEFRRHSVQAPDSGRPEESLTRGRALTLAKTNGSDSGSREPFESFSPELPEDSPDRRAGEFVDRYKALHVRLRKGAHYVGNPGKDFEESRQLVRVYDDARLDKLAYVWLNTDLEFAQNGTRTIGKMRSQASWCEEQLIAWEEKHGPLQVAS